MSTFRSHKSTLAESDFSTSVKKASGLMPKELIFKRASNIAEILKNLEIGVYKPTKFSKETKRRFTNKCVPNCLVESSTLKLEEKLTRLNFSLDGNMLLTATYNGIIELFNSQHSSYQVCIRIKSYRIADAAISPDATFIACACIDPNLILYHLYDNHNNNVVSKQVLPLEKHNPLFIFPGSVRISSDGNEILLARNDFLFIYNRTENLITELHANYRVYNAVFADNSSQIIYSGGDDNLIRILDRRTLSQDYPKPVSVLFGHTNSICYIDSKDDGRYLISKSCDGTIKLWDIRKASKKTRCYSEGETYIQKSISEYGSDSKLNDLKKQDMSLMTYRSHYGEMIALDNTAARFSPMETTGQRYIYTGYLSGNIVVYDALTGDVVQVNEGLQPPRTDVAWHPTRNEILSTDLLGTLKKWMYYEDV